MPALISKPSSVTGIVTAALVFLGLGMFGTMGWLAALLLGIIAGLLLGGVVGWLTEQGPAAQDGSEWAPVARDALADADADPTDRSGGSLAEEPRVAAHEEDDKRPESGAADNLRRIKGIGVKVAAALEEAGITRFEQIAAWDEAAIDQTAARIGRAAARIRRDDWVGQARALAARSAGWQ